VILRRARSAGGGGFSSGISTQSESLRTSAESDEVDDAVDPRAMVERIRSGAIPPPVAPPAMTPQGDGERDNPRSRMSVVARAGSAAYAKEYRLGLLHRMMMRGVPLDQIAAQLGVSLSTVEKDRAELKRRLREAAKELDINEMVGNQTALYDEVSAMSLRIASAQGQGAAPTPMRLAAMRTALAANADKARFYQHAGVFDVLRFRKSDDGNALSDVQLLMQRTAELLQGLEQEDAPAQATPGGFDPLTFDAGGDSGDAEIQEI
jgi:hypothetical protein